MYKNLKDKKAIEIVEKMIERNQLPKIGTFEITPELLEISFKTYRELFKPNPAYRMKKSEIKLANKIAALNFSKLNLDRQNDMKVDKIKSSSLKINSRAGFVYLISNPSFPGCFKVGMTTNPEKRLLQYQTYDPNRAYKMERVCFVKDRVKVEKDILNNLNLNLLKGEWVSSENVFKVFESIGFSILKEKI